MNRIQNVLTACLIAAFVLVALPTQAQSQKTKVKKDLVKVLKELPPEVQMQVLSYAQRKRDALAAAQQVTTQPVSAKATKITQTPEQLKAKPVAQPAQPTQISLSPQAPSATAAPAPTAPPKQPDYMEKATTMTQTTVEWEGVEHNYGKVKTGAIVKHTFKFKNTGTEPLLLTRVKASCGCTTPSYSKEPIAPGEEGFIDVSFNTAGKSGIQRKSVTVTSNSQPLNMALRINGEVEKE